MSKLSIRNIGQAVGAYVAKNSYRPDQTDFLAFGAEILLGSILKLSTLCLVAALLGETLVVAILLGVTGLVRILSGGAHCTAYYRCLITSISVFIVLGCIIKNSYPYLSLLPPIVLIAIIGLSVYIYWRYSPQAPPNKPFKDDKAKYAFRLYSLIAVAALSTIAIIFGTSSMVAWTIVFSLLWQAFTLTAMGHRFISSLDTLLTPKKREVKENVETF